MATTKSSHRPSDKRIRNSQPTNLMRATACYFRHILIIWAIRNIVAEEGGGGRGWGLGTVRTGINSKRTIDVSETNLKCLSDFCHFFTFDDKSRHKQEINLHGRVRNKVAYVASVSSRVIASFLFFLLSSQRSRRTHAETLAKQASNKVFLQPIYYVTDDVFYKEAYELSVINTKKSLCSGVPNKQD